MRPAEMESDINFVLHCTVYSIRAINCSRLLDYITGTFLPREHMRGRPWES